MTILSSGDMIVTDEVRLRLHQAEGDGRLVRVFLQCSNVLLCRSSAVVGIPCKVKGGVPQIGDYHRCSECDSGMKLFTNWLAI